jgi:hypothetical protein
VSYGLREVDRECARENAVSQAALPATRHAARYAYLVGIMR